MRRRPIQQTPAQGRRQTLITVAVVVFFVAAALLVFRGRSFEARLARVDGVAEVADYLYYEGHREADLILDNGGYIWVARLDDQVFVETDAIYVVAIDDYHLSCSYPEQLGHVSNGHNIVEILETLEQHGHPKVRVKNINDLVFNYDEIVNVLKHMPRRGDAPLPVQFRDRSSKQWYCNLLAVKTKTGRT